MPKFLDMREYMHLDLRTWGSLIQLDFKMQGNTCYIHLPFRRTGNTDTRNAEGDKAVQAEPVQDKIHAF